VKQRNKMNREISAKNKMVTKQTMLNHSFDFAGRLQMAFELTLAKHFKFEALIKGFERVQKGLWAISISLLSITLYSAFHPLDWSPVLMILINIVMIMFGSLSYKYSMDFASRKASIKVNLTQREKDQEKRIKHLLNLVALNFYIALTYFLTVKFQPFVFKQLSLNQMLDQTHSGLFPSSLTQALWFNYNRLPYVLLIFVPGLLPAALMIYTQTYELFIKFREMFEQWGQSRYFKSNIFNHIIENRGADHLPYLRIGLDVNTQTDLYLSPSARTVNLEGLGPIGSGKSAALQRPMLRQDTEKIFMYWRDYAKERRKHKTFKSFEKVWFTEERNGQYINGIKTVDPSNDLASHFFEELLLMGVPREAITYLNPPDPLSDAMQAFSGELESAIGTLVATLMELVTRGSANPNPYYTNQSRTYLMNILYLIKFSSEIPNPIDEKVGTRPTFKEIFSAVLYGGEMIRYERMLALEKFVEVLRVRLEKEQEKTKRTLQEEEAFGNLVNRYNIAERTLNNWKSWLTVTEEGGKLKVEDLMDKDVSGLRTTMSELSQKTGLLRILTRPSNFDFDVLLKFGGFLIVNTSTAVLADYAPTVGKLVSLNFQNAVMRRNTNIDRSGEITESASHNAYFTSADDEKPPYLTSKESDYLSNSRKYKVFNAFTHQATSQYDAYLNPPERDTMLAALRNKFVYQGLEYADAQRYSKTFGSKLVIETDYSKQVYDGKGDADGGRTSAREKIVIKPNITEDQLIKLPQFYMAGQYYDGKEVEPYVLIRTYPFFEEKLTKPEFNRADFDLWYEDVKAALYEAENKNDVDASDPEVMKIINRVGEKQKHDQLTSGGAKDFARRDIAQQLRKPNGTNNLQKPRQSLYQRRGMIRASLDKEPLDYGPDNE
jgi:hypothetical protein